MITWPTNTKEIIDDIRAAIGRPFQVFIKVDGVDCPTCSIDPLTGKSIDPFCPTCSGYGTIITWSSAIISGHINWRSVDPTMNYQVGKIYTGDCKISIEFSEENVNLLDRASYFLVDGKLMYETNRDFRGVPAINRIILSLEQDPRLGD